MNERDRPWHPENFLTFEEERTKLRIGDRKSLIDFDLLPVRFDLREIWIVSEIERQIGIDAVLEIRAGLFHRIGSKLAGRIQLAGLNGRHRREEFEIMGRRQVGDAVERAHLAELAHHVSRDGRPHHGFVFPDDLALDLKSPAVRLAGRARRISQALEWHRKLCRPSVVRERTGRRE